MNEVIFEYIHMNIKLMECEFRQMYVNEHLELVAGAVPPPTAVVRL
eukprot:COSAG03_NODE_7361_length_928_cov_18.778046_3_plen_46_part_00